MHPPVNCSNQFGSCREGTVTLLNAANWENRWVSTAMPSYKGHRYPYRDHQPLCVVVLPVPAQLR